MKILTPRLHGFIDYITVVLFALAPTVLELKGLPAGISYTLAIVHMLLTFATAFPSGVLKVIPFKIHGLIELIVAIALIALPWLLHFSDSPAPRNFYVGIGIVIFIVWLITAYEDRTAS